MARDELSNVGREQDDDTSRAIEKLLEWAKAEGVSQDALHLPSPPSSERLPAFGDFFLIREIGAGGSGTVYEARQDSLSKRSVALKVLNKATPLPQEAERFRREAETIATLDHPAIVSVIAAGIENHRPYIAMKMITGLGVDQLIARLAEKGRPPHTADAARRALGFAASDSDFWLSDYVRWVARVGLELAQALDHAQRNGVVHRDVKPGNVIITPSGRPVLIDFGLASGEFSTELTQSGAFLGTLAYAPPEQLNAGQVDSRADLYSLGALIYELLSLKRANDGKTYSEILNHIQHKTPKAIGEFAPRDLEAICAKALEIDPSRRYADPASMAADFKNFLAGEPTVARPPGLMRRSFLWTRRHLTLTATVLVILLALLSIEIRRRADFSDRVAGLSGSFEELNGDRRRLIELRQSFNQARITPSEAAGTGQGADELRSEMVRIREKLDAQFEFIDKSLRELIQENPSHRSARRALASVLTTRLERAIEEDDDLLRRSFVDELKARLKSIDPDENSLAWLEGKTEIRFDSIPPGSFELLAIDHGDEEPIEKGPLPHSLALAPGSYVAVFHAKGQRTSRIPFVIRPPFAHSIRDRDKTESLTCRLLPSSKANENWISIPTGWALTGEAPATWNRIDAFEIQKFEVTYADWLAYMHWCVNTCNMQPDKVPVPRYLTTSGEHITWDGEAFQLRPSFDPRWPITGLANQEFSKIVEYFDWLEPRDGDLVWEHELPTAAEWERAARGSDGREFPWGRQLDWAVASNHMSPNPQSVRDISQRGGSMPSDVSAFGVHDLGLSVRKFTRTRWGDRGDSFLTKGGSFMSTRPSDLSASRLQAVRNIAFDDIGGRLIRKPIPAWFLEEAKPGSFRHDFEKLSLGDLGEEWKVLIGSGFVSMKPLKGESASIIGGRLVVRGGVGLGSKNTKVLRRIQVDDAGYKVTALFKINILQPRKDAPRGCDFALLSDAHSPAPDAVNVRFPSNDEGELGLIELVVQKAFKRQVLVAPLSITEDEFFRLELERSGQEVALRIWPSTATRPQQPLLTAPLPEGTLRPRFLQLTATNYVGMEFSIDELSFGH